MNHTEKKKILYVITKSNYGGAQRYVHELACAAKRDGYDVAVLSSPHGMLVEKLTHDGITHFPIHSFDRDIHIRNDWRALRELRNVLRTFHPDIVHVNSSKAGGLGALAARLHRVPCIIFTAHGWPFFERRSLLSQILIWLLSYITVLLSHKTIVVSRHDCTHARMWGLRHKLSHIPLGLSPYTLLDRETARTALLSEDDIRAHENALWCIATGELIPNKNTTYVLDALRLLPSHVKEKIFLVIAGDGELRTHLEATVSAYHLEHAVRFLGYVPEVREYLRAFDIFLIPSQKEGLPYGLLEAGAAGLGVIGSSVGGIPEIIDHMKSGLLIDISDPYTLTTALTTLFTNRERIGTYGEALTAHVSEHFRLEHMIERTQTLYDTKSTSRAS